jgi:hypothetical protein
MKLNVTNVTIGDTTIPFMGEATIEYLSGSSPLVPGSQVFTCSYDQRVDARWWRCHAAAMEIVAAALARRIVESYDRPMRAVRNGDVYHLVPCVAETEGL